jgi:hypothetical protein
VDGRHVDVAFVDCNFTRVPVTILFNENDAHEYAEMIGRVRISRPILPFRQR